MWKKFIEAMEKIGQERAEAQLRRMGYRPEILARMANENVNSQA